MKKILSVLLSVMMLLSIMPMSAIAEESAAQSTVTEAVTVLEIADAEDLEAFAAAVNAGDNFAGKKVMLTADIDLANIQWQPIGGSTVYFAGEFDGNGKTISNLTNTEDVARKGLFGLVEKCYIHDLTLKNVKFSGTASSMRVGALAGNLQYYNVIENVVVDGLDYDLNDTNGLIGGLVGYSWTSYVKNCTVKNAHMKITSTNNSTVGVMLSYGRGVGDAITNFPYADRIVEADYQDASLWNYVGCKVEGATVTLNGTVSFGGFLGADTYNHWRNYAKDCTVTGLNVIAKGDGVYTVGGFMSGQYGGIDPNAISNCSVEGTITSLGTNTASTFGGFFGYVGGRPGGATECVANVDITVAAGDVGGFAGETQQYFAHQYEFENCVSNGDVSTEAGNAGSFIANIQHGGDGSALNVVISGCEANGEATTANGETGFVGSVNDIKKETNTGGDVTVSNSTQNGEEVTTEDINVAEGTVIEPTVGIFAAKIGTTNYSTLADAIAAAGDGAIIEVFNGTHTMPNSVVNKNITIKGSKDTVIEMLTAVNASNSTIAFEGITAKFDNDNFEGLQHSVKVTYTNCTIEGKQHLYAPTVVFTDCILNNQQDYSVWTYGATDVTFTGCTFNSGGKAILVYNEDTSGSFVADIKVSNCIFNDDDTLDTKKAAIELGNNPAKTNTYKLAIEECTVNGFAVNDEGTSTGSTLWGNKNSMAVEDLEVIIDGVDVLDVPKGEVSRGMYSTSNNRIQGAVMNANPKESVVLELYSGETKIATTTLTNADYLVNAATELTWSFCITDTSSSWSTVWEEGHPVSDAKPDKVVLYIDGVNVAENTVTLHKDNFDMVGEEAVWSEIEGVTSKVEEPVIGNTTKMLVVKDYMSENYFTWGGDNRYHMLITVGIDDYKKYTAYAGFDVTINGHTERLLIADGMVWEKLVINGLEYNPSDYNNDSGVENTRIMYYVLSFDKAFADTNPEINIKAFVQEKGSTEITYIREGNTNLLPNS